MTRLARRVKSNRLFFRKKGFTLSKQSTNIHHPRSMTAPKHTTLISHNSWNIKERRPRHITSRKFSIPNFVDVIVASTSLSRCSRFPCVYHRDKRRGRVALSWWVSLGWSATERLGVGSAIGEVGGVVKERWWNRILNGP